MIRRLLTALLLLVGIGLTATAVAGGATAAPYPPSNPASITASAYDPCAGASNIIGGNGFQPGETVRLVLAGTGEIGRAVVRADGTFQVTVTVPLSARGSNQVLATGLTSARSASLTLDVPCVVGQSDRSSQLPSSGSGGLAYTGVAVGGAVLLGVVLFGAGAALVLAGRRRRGHSVAR